MPDDNSTQEVGSSATEEDSGPELVKPPLPPCDPSTVDTQSVGEQRMESDVRNIKDRLKSAEKWMIFLTAAIVLVGILQFEAALLQWNAMKGQLEEMRQGGGTAANQLWQAIGNMNWMARTADGSLHQTREAMETSKRESEISLTASVEESRLDLRAWIVLEPLVPVLAVPEAPPQGVPSPYRYELVLENVGKTPAYHVKVMMIQLLGFRGRLENSSTQIANTQDMMLMGKFKNGPSPDEIKKEFPTVISPNARRTTSIFFFLPGRPNDPNSRALENYEVGRIDYEDVFHVKHWRKFCLFVKDSAGTLEDCSYGNDEDHNPEIHPQSPASKPN